MNSRRIARWLVEELDGPRKGQVRILGPQHGEGNRGEIVGHDDCRRPSRLSCSAVLGVREEGNVTGGSFFNAFNGSDLCVWGSVFEAQVKSFGDLRKFHRRMLPWHVIVMEPHCTAILWRYFRGKD